MASIIVYFGRQLIGNWCTEYVEIRFLAPEGMPKLLQCLLLFWLQH
jgi:hypothetical protein